MPLSGGAEFPAAPVAPMAHALQAWAPSPTVDETVGDRLRRARKRAGYASQESLAEAARVPRGYVADLESNAVTNPRDPERLRRVARACKVSLRWLAAPLKWYEDEPKQAPLIVDGRSFESLADEDLEAIEKMAERLERKPRGRTA